MALLWCDGFESYGSSGNSVGMGSKYYAENLTALDVVAGRDSTYNAIALDTAGKFFTPHLTTNTTLIAGFSFKLENLAVASRNLVMFRIPSLDGTTVSYRCMDLLTTNNSEIYVNFNGASIGANTTINLTANTWYYCEFKVVTNTSTGSISVRFDGVEVLANSSINTRFSATYPYYSSVGFNGEAGQILTIDDFYVCDGSGAVNNDFRGPCIVRDIRPTADVSGNWTANGGGDKYVEVDEASQDTTSFIYTGTTGNEQIFETTNHALSGNVYGVMTTVDAMLTGNATLGLKILTKQGTGTTNVGTEYPVGYDTYQALTRIDDVDPDGNTWNQTLLNGLRIGVRAD